MSEASENRELERAFADLRPAPDSELARARAHAHRSLFGPKDDQAGEPELDEPLTVGRYRLLANVGRGGLGHVWAAHDPQLDRVVAVKLLRDQAIRRHRRARAQLLAEAAVMARLTHPNVVRVYDVGDHEGELFVAMEYVEGQTLRAWQLGRTDWRELLDVYLLAGEGLAAAHASGLVHGDFKPDNVLIGNDGRVLVSDFGVAPHLIQAHLEGALGSGPDDDTGDVDSAMATHEEGGAPMTVRDSSFSEALELIGTPAYMAPEQLDGRRADVLADQFALCVSLWEALMGERPFQGQTPERLRQAIGQGPREPKRRIPAPLLALLRRGLAEAPSARHPDLATLLARLRRLRTRRRRWSMIAGVAALVATTIAGLAYGLLVEGPARESPSCSLEQRLEWGDEQRAALERRLASEPLALSDDRVALALARLDDFADAWTSARQLTCVLNDHEGEPGVARFHERSLCLVAAEAEFDATLAVLSTAEAKPSMVAQPLIAALPDPGHCVRPDQGVAIDDDPERAEQLAVLRRGVAQVRATRLGQQHEPALRLCVELLAAAESLGDAALLAALELEQGRLLRHVGSSREGLRRLQRASSLAATIDDRELALEAASEVAFSLMALDGDPREFEAWAERAVLLGERVGDPVAAMHGRLLLGRAAMLLDRPDEALAIQQDALARAERELDPDNPELAYAHDFLGGTHGELGHVEQAIEHKLEAIAILERTYGPDHMDLVTLLATAANIHALVGRREQAEPLFERSLAIPIKLLGREHRRTRSVARRFAEYLFDEGRPSEAEALLVGDPNPWSTVFRADWALDSNDRALAREQIATLEREGEVDDAPLQAAIFELRGRLALAEDNRERAETMAEGLLVIGRALGTREFELPALHIRAELELRKRGELTPATRSRLADALARVGVRPERALRARMLLWRVATAGEREAMRAELERAWASAYGRRHPLRRAFDASLVAAPLGSGLEPDR
ncbi:protein kinase domain-containing protein [Nannocystaceae bacterium ST9]